MEPSPCFGSGLADNRNGSEGAMLTKHDRVDCLRIMNDRVNRASAVTVELFSEVLSTACDRLPVLSRLGKTALVKQLTASQA